jgi:tetratricopeptide (TPR) repeat protein
MNSKNEHINFLFGLLLFAITVILYSQSLSNPLVFDDLPVFVEETLKWYGTSVFKLDLRWFAYASFGWTYDLFGMNLFWYRAGNLVLHAATSILLFVFFRRLLSLAAQPQEAEQQTHWPAFCAALVFALHPVTVYGVAYLVERTIIMATLFGIASLFCYMEGLARDRFKWFLWSAVFYFLAVFSKEHSVMIPAVAAALTLLLQKPSLPLIKKIWIPFVLYFAIGLLIVLRAKGVLGAPYEPYAAKILARMSEQQPGFNIENAYGLSVITEGFLFFKYLFLWVVPYVGEMAVDIRQPFATHFTSMPQLPGFIAFLIYPIVATKFLLKGGRTGLIGFGLLFPWLLYLTELSSIRIQEPFVLYRSYLWLSGFLVVLLALLSAASRKTNLILIFVLCPILAALAWNRLDTFSSNLKLWSDVISKIGDEKLLGSERGYINRGGAYLELRNLPEAQKDFKKAIALNPQKADSYLNAGIANLLEGNLKEAQQHFDTAIKLQPEFPEVYLNFGIIKFKQGQIEEALQHYNKALKFKPDYADAYLNRGVLFMQTGRHAEALNDFSRSLEIRPKNADAYLNRGLIYLKLGNIQESFNDLDEAIHFNPNLANAYMNRGIVNMMQQHVDSALIDLSKALQLDPKDSEIYFNRGIVFAAIGRYQEAFQDYGRALELNANYADAHVNRGGLFMMLNQMPEAMAEFDRAIRINPNHENAYFNRGNIFASQSRHQKALDDFDKALGLNPKNAQALLHRGFILLSLNRKEEAIKSFRKSCDAGNKKGCEMSR